MNDILARIDQALTQCPACKRHVDDDPRILSLYGRCYDCKFKDAGNHARDQIAELSQPRCQSTWDDRRCDREVGHEGDHRSPLHNWPREVMPPAPLEPDPDEPCGPNGEALTCVTTVDDHRCVREIRHDGRHWFGVPRLDGEPAEPVAAEDWADAVQPRANGGVIHASQPYLLVGNGCTYRVDIRRWLKRWFR